MRRSNLRLLVVAIIAVPLQLVGTPVWAAPKETDDAETLIDAAEIATDEGRHRDAADGYSRAYRKLPLSLRTGPVGAQLITRAVESYRRVAADEGAEALDGCVALLEQHLEDLRTQGKTEQLAALEETLARLRKEVREGQAATEVESDRDESKVDEPPPPKVAVVPNSTPPRDDTRERSQRSVGIGLLAAGAVVTAGGVGMLVAGPLLHSTARNRIDERGGTHEGDEEYLDNARTIRNALLISGGVTAALGITGIAVGAARLARAKRSRNATAFGLAPGPEGGVFVVSGRF